MYTRMILEKERVSDFLLKNYKTEHNGGRVDLGKILLLTFGLFGQGGSVPFEYVRKAK